MPRGHHTFRVEPEESGRALAILARYACVVGASYADGVVRFQIDLFDLTIEPESGSCVELAIKRELQKALSLHSIDFQSPGWSRG